MKSLRSIVFTMVSAGMVAGTPALFARPPLSPAPQNSTNQVQPPARTQDHMSQAIDRINNASDPSAAVEGYAQGAAIDPGSITLKEAYVKRLVALRLPELAETQARDLTIRRPDLGLPWAVTAYMEARRGNTRPALEDIFLAFRRAANDPFVLRTAGQLLAYYDLHAADLQIDAGLKNTLEDMRKTLSSKPEFTQAYQQAKDDYSQVEQQPAVEPSAQQTLPPVYDDYSNYATYAPVYTNPYDVAYASDVWWPSVWWWGPGAIIIDRPFFHHHHFDRFDFHHHVYSDRLHDHYYYYNDRFDHRLFGDHFNDRFLNNRFDNRFNNRRFENNRPFLPHHSSGLNQRHLNTAPHIAPRSHGLLGNQRSFITRTPSHVNHSFATPRRSSIGARRSIGGRSMAGHSFSGRSIGGRSTGGHSFAGHSGGSRGR
jgi:hypothetical protein